MSLYRMARDTQTARIYPGVPEYFNGEGRGLYLYLTGSASWLVLTIVTQVLGIRGLWGDLLLAPKLVGDQFGRSGQVIGEVHFAGKRLRVTYVNRAKKSYGKYRVASVMLQGRSWDLPQDASDQVLIPRAVLEAVSGSQVDITVALT
jgi:cellobiose phosphorylase